MEYMTNRHKERSEAVDNDLMKEQDRGCLSMLMAISCNLRWYKEIVNFLTILTYHRINVNNYWNRRKLWQTETHKVLDLSQLED